VPTGTKRIDDDSDDHGDNDNNDDDNFNEIQVHLLYQPIISSHVS